MTDLLDDWFGFDPPPPVPEAKTPARPAPTRRKATDNVVVGVDAKRRFAGGKTTTGVSQPSRTSIVGEDDSEGIGLNV